MQQKTIIDVEGKKFWNFIYGNELGMRRTKKGEDVCENCYFLGYQNIRMEKLMLDEANKNKLYLMLLNK